MRDKRNKLCFASIDVEHDFGSGDNKIFHGVEEIDKIFQVFDRFNVPLTLFVTGDVLERYGEKVKSWARRYEIASHSYSHIFFNNLSDVEKEEEIGKFVDIYKKVFGFMARGFRAPSHVIDKVTLSILDRYGFVYDSSVVPHYPPLKKYRGYPPPPEVTLLRSDELRRGKGRAPVEPYNIGGLKLLEIPVSGQILGFPLAGAWIKGLPVILYRLLFIFNKPNFITLSMHSWDLLDKRFEVKLIKILEILKNNRYVFKSGEQIAVEELTE